MPSTPSLPEGWTLYREEPPTQIEKPGQYYAEKVIDGARIEAVSDSREGLIAACKEYESLAARRIPPEQQLAAEQKTAAEAAAAASPVAG